jgi:citronellol/citronellal dehydrogenase
MESDIVANLAGKTLFITGASRGIGLAIALRAARDGANIAVVAKSAVSNPKLPGTIHTAAAQIEDAGGRALALQCDIREEDHVRAAVVAAVDVFGGIDILVNNASAIWLRGTLDTPMKRFDLMQQVNSRGSFLCAQACLPYLLQAPNPHILTLCPPPSLEPKWWGPHTGYTLAKMGMSLVTLGLAAEFGPQGVAVNGLWPRTLIAASALATGVRLQSWAMLHIWYSPGMPQVPVASS